jgi:hypothetical protein
LPEFEEADLDGIFGIGATGGPLAGEQKERWSVFAEPLSPVFCFAGQIRLLSI